MLENVCAAIEKASRKKDVKVIQIFHMTILIN